MSNSILVINSGSSSIKFSVFEDPQQDNPKIVGLAERLGTPEALLSWRVEDQDKQSLAIANADHGATLKQLMLTLKEAGIQPEQLNAVGHRVVHGGEKFAESVVVTPDIFAQIEQCNHLAPLHNPANLLGIKTLMDLYPAIPQIAVFDTAFHQSLSAKQFLYAVPYELYQDHGVRRYGFHGTSHRYVVQKAAQQLNLPLEDSAFISAHLGNGCSATAILNGKSVDTTMGMTPLEGLVMGTRSGDVDPSLHEFLANRLNLDLHQVTELLNKKSGLLGLSGLSNDMRTLSEAAASGNQQAQLAIDVFCFRLAKSIAALTVSLGRLDALIFTGGIGENAFPIRAQVLNELTVLGFNLDPELNRNHGRSNHGLITTSDSTKAVVVNTNEEWMIAQDCQNLVPN